MFERDGINLMAKISSRVNSNFSGNVYNLISNNSSLRMTLPDSTEPLPGLIVCDKSVCGSGDIVYNEVCVGYTFGDEQ